jgi:hypothetical protein
MDKHFNYHRMRASSQKSNPFRCILLWSIANLLFSCSTAQHIEKKQTNEVYNNLGLIKDRKDNFALYKEAASWLHVPHVDGGTSRNGIDCSFLVYSFYKTVYNKTLERNSASMLNKNCKRIKRSKLKEGDLVFFNTSGKSKSNITHVGIYLKNNKFLHASTSKGVNVSDLDEDYYRRAWICGGRVK